MDAMLLSAGLGRRMRPRTRHTPKPLLKVSGRCLIEYQLDRLSTADISTVVINTSYASEKFVQKLGDGASYGLNIKYSHEGETPLETGGGIQKALPFIESDPFLVVNADIWTDYAFAKLSLTDDDADGCLLLVDNPVHNSQGDFCLVGGKVLLLDASKRAQCYTYSGISMLRKSLFQKHRGGALPLRDYFVESIKRGTLAGTHYQGTWLDIGTPDRLAALDEMIRNGRVSFE